MIAIWPELVEFDGIGILSIYFVIFVNGALQSST